MTAWNERREWMPSISRQPMTVRALVLSIGFIVVAAMLAAPAPAAPIDDGFLSALDNAGVNYGDPGSAVAMGQSICPMLAQPGSTFASTASGIIGNNGISPAMAGLFTSIAISTYCPSMMASLADGNVPSLPQLPGVPGV